IGEEQYEIKPNIGIFKISIIKGKNFKYVLYNKKMYRCSKKFEETNLKLLEICRKNYITEVIFSKSELSELFSIVIPKINDAIIIEDSLKEEFEKYKPKQLKVKVFLDFDR